jgi:hypothetical protein
MLDESGNIRMQLAKEKIKNCRAGDLVKEMGGYFGFELLINRPYHQDMVELNTGRNALLYLVKARKIKKVFIPYFLCDSVSDMLQKNSIQYEYYPINNNLMPVLNHELNGNEYLYVVNYYGQIDEDKIRGLKDRYGSIIVDNTQAFFQRPLPGIDTIYSCRKFFGVSDGAYLSTDAFLEAELEVDISKDRMGHILGRFEGKASDYYEKCQKNDESFKELPLKKMSKLTRTILGAIDYEKIRATRNHNFEYLHEKLRHQNGLTLQLPYGAFLYPFHIRNGSEIRIKMVERKFYIATLWPNVLRDHNKDSLEYNFASNILPLPCDQRYSLEDMDLMLVELRKYLG